VTQIDEEIDRASAGDRLVIEMLSQDMPRKAVKRGSGQRQAISLLEEAMKTGTDATYDGLYVSECCCHETTFVKDQTFTRCPKCSGLTIWELVEADARPAAA
jgi:hypothetical protein